jgi:hypothetical protein
LDSVKPKSWQAPFVAAMRDGVRIGRAIGLTTHPPEQNAREAAITVCAAGDGET